MQKEIKLAIEYVQSACPDWLETMKIKSSLALCQICLPHTFELNRKKTFIVSYSNV